MRYLIALFIPPLAVFMSGRPISAVLNIFLSLLFYFPGAIHAVMVVSGDAAEERNRELMTAVTGKPIPRKAKPEMRALIGGAVGILVVGATAFVLTTFFPGARLKFGSVDIPLTTPPQTPRAAAAAPAPQLPAITGWTMQEVTSRHGPPLSTDKATGLAAWPAFTARFESGAVQEVLAP